MYILMLSVRQNIWGAHGFHTHSSQILQQEKTLPNWPKLPMGCRWTSDTFGLKVPALSSTYHCKGTVKNACRQRFQGMRYILDGLEKRHVYTDARHLPGFFSSEQDNDVQKKWGLQNATFLKERWLKFFMTSWQLSEPPNLAPPKSPVVDWVLGFNAHDNKNPKTNFCLNRRLA